LKEKNKILIFGLCYIIIAIFVFLMLSQIQYEKYTNQINIVIAEIVDKIVEKYPDVEEEEIIKILNGTEQSQKKYILEKYGYTQNTVAIGEISKERSSFIKIDIAIIIAGGIVVTIVLLSYNKKREEKISDINSYIGKVNRGNYELKIEENGEDELTKLRNELYKTTVLLRETAENSEKEKTNLSNSLTDISHQLKTPLTSIRIMIDNIQNNPDMDEKTRNEFIEDISKQIDWISSLVISLLKLAKFDAGSIVMRDEEINVKKLIQNIISNLAILIDIKDIKIEENISEQITLFADYNWQIEALTNIIKNCVEHSFDGGKIKIEAESNSVFTKIIITDEGEGIEKKDLNRIFERFYKSAKSSENSIGIGLALAKTIIEKERGYIKVESEVGKGTKFEIKYLK
jgi:signal transduction histidine kinase